jgi:hypothetical protein
MLGAVGWSDVESVDFDNHSCSDGTHITLCVVQVKTEEYDMLGRLAWNKPS